MEIKALRTKKIKAAKIGILSQKMFLLMTVFIIGLVFGTMSLRNPGDDYALKIQSFTDNGSSRYYHCKVLIGSFLLFFTQSHGDKRASTGSEHEADRKSTRLNSSHRT